MNQTLMVWGLGNPLQGDDRAGIEVVLRLQAEARPKITAINCETTPGNFIPLVRRENPHTLVLVDAADMGLPPGSVRLIPAERVSETCFTSHDFSLDLMLRGVIGRTRLILVGIQPARVALTLELSPPVCRAVEDVVSALLADRLGDVPVLGEATS